jgi:peptidoglycan/LPS O-acetylase OafA/YrhL
LDEQRYFWIDFLKGIAILAVVMNHLYGIVYSSQKLVLLTAYSVTLLVTLSGITACISVNKRDSIDWNYLKGRLLNIFVPYSIAVLFAHLYTYKGNFDLYQYLKELSSFSFSGYYFIAILLQLILVSTFLVWIFKSCNGSIIKQCILLVLTYFLSVFLERYAAVQGIVLGGKYVLGGSFLFVFCIGIMFYYNRALLSGERVNIILLLISLIGAATFIINNYLIRAWTNPPNKYNIMYSAFIFFIFYAPFQIFSERIWNNKVTNIIADLGKNSMYIFLYHLLFISLATDACFKKALIEGSILFKLWVVILSIIPPYFIGKCLRPWIKKRMFYKNTTEN